MPLGTGLTVLAAAALTATQVRCSAERNSWLPLHSMTQTLTSAHTPQNSRTAAGKGGLTRTRSKCCMARHKTQACAEGPATLFVHDSCRNPSVLPPPPCCDHHHQSTVPVQKLQVLISMFRQA